MAYIKYRNSRKKYRKMNGFRRKRKPRPSRRVKSNRR